MFMNSNAKILTLMFSTPCKLPVPWSKDYGFCQKKAATVLLEMPQFEKLFSLYSKN